MRRIAFTIALVAVALIHVPGAAHAGEYGHYDINKIVAVSRSESGQDSVTISFMYLGQLINDLQSHAASYPPRFDSPDDLGRARADVKALSGILDIAVNTPSPSQKLLLRAAVLNSVGHNLDVPGTGQRAMAAFAALLRQAPDDPQANFLYGKFLFDAGRPADAIPILQKATSLGFANADYFLGLAYLTTGDKEKALETLERYAKHAPNDANAPKIIDAIRNGQVHIKKSGQ
jgi:tetratricopeptide (TPR) repeat protein